MDKPLGGVVILFFNKNLIFLFFFTLNRSVSTSDILRLQEIEARRRQIYGLRTQSVSTNCKQTADI